jgi:hypothetical protein
VLRMTRLAKAKIRFYRIGALHRNRSLPSIGRSAEVISTTLDQHRSQPSQF